MKRMVWRTFLLLTVLGFFLIPSTVLRGNPQGHLPQRKTSQSPYSSVSRASASNRARYEPHSPITITSNTDFSTQATSENWPGNGSEVNPYMIEGLTIIGPSDRILIEIHDTDVHFLIHSCFLSQGQRGIYFFRVINGHLSNNIVTNNSDLGICLERSGNNSLSNNTVTSNGMGIELSHSENILLSNNTVTNNHFAGIWLESSSICRLIGNTIANHFYCGIVLVLGCSENSIQFNNFHANYLGGNSQAWEDPYYSSNNNFEYNYWSDLTGPDNDGDGIVDQYYYIGGGYEGYFDYYPLVVPNPLAPNYPVPHHLIGIFISPNGGELLTGTIDIQWAIFDSDDHNITYSVSYSADGGITWTQVKTELNTSFYTWYTTTVMNGSQYLVRVNVSCSEGSGCVLTSETAFTINNHRHLQLFIVLSPVGGEIYFGLVTVQWTPATDVFNHDVTYTVSYSADNGHSWITLRSNLSTTSFGWISTTVTDGSQYLIQVNASCSEWSWRVATSGAAFILDNVPPLTSLPPTHTSDPSIHTDAPLDLLPVLQILSPVVILAFLLILVIVIRRQQMD